MCGVFGVFGHAEASHITHLGLHALQHRGQESAGIVTEHDGRLFTHRGMGHVQDVFDEATLAKLPGKNAIGHVRYSTTGESQIVNAQPLSVTARWGLLSVAHNGNLVNTAVLHDQLENEGALFQSTMDTEVFVHLVARSRAHTIEERIAEALRATKGAYSVLFLTEGKLIAARDPQGFRPLVLGRLHHSYIVASETTALDLLDAAYMREIEPGEMVVIDAHGTRSLRFGERAATAKCIFEYVYFARPDTNLFGIGVIGARRRMGQELAREKPAEADIVIPVPDSGVHAAMGYAEASGLRFELGLVRSHYVGRTFIEPSQLIRNLGVKRKLSPVRDILRGQRVVVIDDSIVRGTTSRKIVQMIRDAGAREVHMRISSPPTTHSCFYGIDTPNRGELIAAQHTVDEIAEYLGADSLAYLSLDGLHRAVAGEVSKGYCSACFTGEYPVAVETPAPPAQLRLNGV